jgi:hypothetical protein
MRDPARQVLHVPAEIFIAMPDGSLIEIDAVGGCKLATRQ